MRPVLTCWIVLLVPVFVRSAEPVDYLRDVKPILRDRCFACHGALAQKASLRLDSGSHILKGRRGEAVVVPKKPHDSALLSRIESKDESDRMPPEGQTLTAEEISKIRRWIEAGAIFPVDDRPEPDPSDHWAFRRPTRPQIPTPLEEKSAHPVDRFLANTWQTHQLKPQPLAEPRLVLRRLYLDLIGLPPSLAEQEAFAANPTEQAYTQIVDKLLASPQYGERWGRHFLDIWRYSDWWGLGAEVRNSQKHMWHWRDWVVESFNADKGYDQMIREMLAADELDPNNLDTLRATGFLARQYFLFNRNSWMEETVEHTSKAFLGLTWNCARCHDHKYDPIKQDDYYRLRAFFEPYQIRMEMLPGELDFEKDGLPRAFDCNLTVPTYRYTRGDEKQPETDRPLAPGLPQFLAPKGITIQPVELPPEAVWPGLRPHVLANWIQAAEERRESARKARNQAKAHPAKSAELQQALLRHAEALLAVADAELLALRARAAADKIRQPEREEAKTAARAEKAHALAKAEESLAKLELDVLTGTKEQQKGLEARRKPLLETVAKARKSLEKPGTQYMPISGALKTRESNIESDASRNKPFPTTSTGRRSALANWIASRENPLTARVAVNHLWLRHFGKPLVANVFDFGRKGQLPTHPELLDWLAVELMEHNWSLKHLHRLMVTSQSYRRSSSNASADARNLDRDPENRYLWRQNSVRMDAPTLRDSVLSLAGKLDTQFGGPAVPPDQQTNSMRRSIYFFQSHNQHNRFLNLFDDANVLDCYRRTESIVPQQALALSNSKFAMSMAENIAGKLADQQEDPAFVVASFQLILATTPTTAEMDACVAALSEFRNLASGSAEQKSARARVLFVQALLNHNDFVTIR